jgi:hypothetical protein
VTPKLPPTAARTSAQATTKAPIPATAENDNPIDGSAGPMCSGAAAPAAGAAVSAISDCPHSPHQ